LYKFSSFGVSCFMLRLSEHSSKGRSLGMLFQTFENDIELRLELQFCIENHCVFFKDIFCMMVTFD